MEDEIEYKEGFNASFLLAEHNPVLLEKVSKNIMASSDYLEGFVDGKKQFELEIERHELEQLQKLRGALQERDIDRATD